MKRIGIGLGLILLAGVVSGLSAKEVAGALPAFHKQYVSVDVPGYQGQIHVLSSSPTAGQAEQVTMLCLAPNPASGNYFRLFLSELGTDRVTLAPDYPGLGNSDAAEGYMDTAAYARIMAATLEALGYGQDGKGPVDVCGYHTGAYVAQELAIQRPDLVRRLLLLGIPYFVGEERDRLYSENVYEREMTESLEQLQEAWDFAVTHRQDGVTLERAYANFLDTARARPVRSHAYHAAFSYDGAERAKLVQQPVLILNTHGGLKEETRALEPYFPNAEIIEIPELHHGVFDVGAKLLADKARPFLDRP